MAMSDDLPRTLRREREARERAGMSAASPIHGAPGAPSYAPEPAYHDNSIAGGATVTDIQIPFRRLVMFCFKLVFAAVPALIVLGAMIWLAGHLLMTYLPWLVKVQILIRVP